MKDLLEALQGKKTYGIVLIVILIVVAEQVLGWDVPGTEIENPLQWILAALGLGTLRAGVGNNND